MASQKVLSTAERLLASHAAATSEATFVYPTTTQAGFGQELEERHDVQRAKVYQMETRPGAGSALAGYLNALVAPSTSSQSLTEGPVSALLGSETLKLMAPSLLSLTPGPRPSFALHVAAVAQGEVISEGLADVLGFAAQLASVDVEERTAIVFSGSKPQEIVGIGVGLASSLAKAGYDLVHAFDGVEGGVEQTVFSPLGSSVDGIKSAAHEAASLEVAVALGLAAVSQQLGSSANFFSYAGSLTATHVLVAPASAAASHAVAALELLPPAAAEKVGVLTVRVLRPWSTAQLVQALPATAQVLHAYTETGSELLLELILASAAEFKRSVRTIAARTPSGVRLSAPIWAAQMLAAVGATESLDPSSLLAEGAKLVSIWGPDDAKDGAALAGQLAQAFAGESGGGIEPRLAVEYDNYAQGGIQHASLVLSPPGSTSDFSPSVIAATSPPSLVVLQNATSVLASYAPLSSDALAPTTQVLVAAPGWTPEEYEVKFDATVKEDLWNVFGTQEQDPVAGQGGVWSVDISAVSAATGVAPTAVTELAVWLLYVGQSTSKPQIAALLKTLDTFRSVEDVAGLAAKTEEVIKHVRIPAAWAKAASEGETPAIESARAADVALQHGLPTQESVTESKAGPGIKKGEDDSIKLAQAALPESAQVEQKPARLVGNAAGPNPSKAAAFAEPDASQTTWREAAKTLMYPESYGTVTDSKRPDLPEDNFILKVTENRRLTPADYDRNVFHMELSTAGTGLRYEIGEALGVHGWNDEDDVKDFLAWYGLDAADLVKVPARADPQGATETRTVFQAFQQNLDVFGKPPKSFFEELSKVATVKSEKDSLRFIASAEGSSTFKKWSETDTVTYADVFKAFPSARFPLADLVRHVEPIKPRHYSIASSQNFVGDSVHLLVVTVDWDTPAGSKRFGQCTRYLAGLNVGDEVMVSVKPSVMKLPKNGSAPIIMAGLGTGAAPFRAFIQENAWRRSKGLEVGPLYYYFGSRHRSKEYLYGEELEAYMRDGVVTHAGLAFSRDGPRKVYIQHKMIEDAAKLAQLISAEAEGAFYLCGPTWPVPDIYVALCEALKGTGKSQDEAEAYLSEMKEEERYILEVY